MGGGVALPCVLRHAAVQMGLPSFVPLFSKRKLFRRFFHFVVSGVDCFQTEDFLINFLVMKCFAQSAIKPTGRSRTEGRNHEQTPTLEVGGKTDGKSQKIRELDLCGSE